MPPIRVEYAEKKRELQEQSGISHQTRKTLQAFLRMEQLSAEASAEGVELGEVKRRIDGKGVVIFSLDSCGTVRDTGKKIFFSGYDPKAKRAAVLYSVKKWGKRLAGEKSCIMFQSEREVDPAVPELSKKQKGLSR